MGSTPEKDLPDTHILAVSEIDLEALAELILELLRRELALENERLGK
jgi:hypothetical protein